jgi:hypothetical protein
VKTGVLIGMAVILALLVGSGFPFIVHHLPYGSLLALMVWAALAADYNSRAVSVVAVFHVILFLVIWPLGSLWIWSEYFSGGAP